MRLTLPPPRDTNTRDSRVPNSKSGPLRLQMSQSKGSQRVTEHGKKKANTTMYGSAPQTGMSGYRWAPGTVPWRGWLMSDRGVRDFFGNRVPENLPPSVGVEEPARPR